ncbi:MAG: tetratricopeptide repeat protein, partial [Candidatus Rokubacteria bacterium]|nr:tetratricopeptide repeat protein [Candidatus Rokubacteria bacterium]
AHCLAIGTHYAAGGVWAKAVAFLRRAGSAAADRSAYREAAASFERAMAALEHWPPGRATTEQAIDLRGDLARAYLPLGRHRERLALRQEAERLAVAIGDPTRLGWAHLGMAGVLRYLLESDRAIAYGEWAIAAAQALGDRALRINASYTLGLTHLEAGHRDLAIELFRTVATLIAQDASAHPGTRGPYAHLRPAALAWLGTALAEVGRFPEAVAHAEEAVRLTADTRPHDVLRALHCLGMVHYHQGNTVAARPLFEREVALAESTDNQDWLAAAYAGLGRTLARSGRGEEGIFLMERSIAVEIAGTGVVGAHRIRQLGEAYLAAGRVEEALARGLEALDRARGQDRQQWEEAPTLALLGAALMAREPPDPAGAEAHYLEALAGATRLGLRPLAARCDLGLGRLYRWRGASDRAREHLERALGSSR